MGFFKHLHTLPLRGWWWGGEGLLRPPCSALTLCSPMGQNLGVEHHPGAMGAWRPWILGRLMEKQRGGIDTPQPHAPSPSSQGTRTAAASPGGCAHPEPAPWDPQPTPTAPKERRGQGARPGRGCSPTPPPPPPPPPRKPPPCTAAARGTAACPRRFEGSAATATAGGQS